MINPLHRPYILISSYYFKVARYFLKQALVFVQQVLVYFNLALILHLSSAGTLLACVSLIQRSTNATFKLCFFRIFVFRSKMQ